jgi:hypothetical protein
MAASLKNVRPGAGDRSSPLAPALLAPLSDRRLRSRFPHEPAHDIDQLAVSSAGGVAELIEQVRIGQMAQVNELADPLSSVKLQLGRPVSQKNAPELAMAEQII